MTKEFDKVRLQKRMMKLAQFDNYFFNNCLNEASKTIQTYMSIYSPPEQLNVGGGSNQGFYSINIDEPLDQISFKDFRKVVKQKLLDKLVEVQRYPFDEITSPSFENKGSLKTAFNSLYAIVIDCYYANQIEEQKKNNN
jgi:hypothetical protein